MKLFEDAAIQKVVYVPGDPFYPVSDNASTLKLNYTNSTHEEIDEGIKRRSVVFNNAINSR